jgi:hypothetical protein
MDRQLEPTCQIETGVSDKDIGPLLSNHVRQRDTGNVGIRKNSTESLKA